MKIEKIKKNRDFQLIYNKGKKEFGYYTLIFFEENKDDEIHLGAVTSKKTGNAVCRNRIRRLIREYFRLNNLKFEKGFDIVCVAKKKAGENIKTLKYKDIEKDLNKIFKRANIVKWKNFV